MENTDFIDHETNLVEGEEQFLTFKLDGQDYGVDIIKVQEIRGWSAVTPIPNSPQYIRGVLNLRGTIVPVIDLRLRFSLEEAEYDSFTVIIVVNINDRWAGMVVDSVSDVVNANANQHCDSPEFEGQVNRQFIQSLVQIEGKLLILLNVDELMNAEILENASELIAE